jgi:hypothetical protein
MQGTAPTWVPRRVGREFAELICADDQWLREEFDALIAASYGAPPAWPGPPAPPDTPPTGRPWRYEVPAAPDRLSDRDPAAAGSGIRRQRSPPPLRRPPVVGVRRSLEAGFPRRSGHDAPDGEAARRMGATKSRLGAVLRRWTFPPPRADSIPTQGSTSERRKRHTGRECRSASAHQPGRSCSLPQALAGLATYDQGCAGGAL